MRMEAEDAAGYMAWALSLALYWQVWAYVLCLVHRPWMQQLVVSQCDKDASSNKPAHAMLFHIFVMFQGWRQGRWWA